jgi:hypothetical protein
VFWLLSNESLAKKLGKTLCFVFAKGRRNGNFYWVGQEGDRVCFEASDYTVNGVPGALESIVCSNALNRTIEEFKLRDSCEILDNTTDLLIEAFVQNNQGVKDGMDICLCCFKKKTIPILLLEPILHFMWSSKKQLILFCLMRPSKMKRNTY